MLRASFIKFLSPLAVCLLALPISAATSDWCVWDNEEYLKAVVKSDYTWMEAVYDLHASADSKAVSGDFEALGSCRFMDRALGETAQDVINKYVDKNTYSYIIPTRAYLRYNNDEIAMVIPSAFYSSGSNWLYVKKDFYAMNRPLCEKQKAEMVEIGKTADGIPFVDVEYKENVHGGISAIINGSSPQANYLGLCHFHKVEQ